MDEIDASSESSATRTSPMAVVVGMAGLAAVGFLLFSVFQTQPEPPPAAIAGNPLLVQGREVYLDRCVSCHGTKGYGDGPIARGLAGPPPRNFVKDEWKHGKEPDQVLQVVAKGVPNTTMPGWLGTLGAEKTRAVSAFVMYLAGLDSPKGLREGKQSSPK